MDLVECSPNGKRRLNGKFRGPDMRGRGGVVTVLVATGKALAWIAACLAALAASGAGARWLISTSFVARDAAAADFATKSDMSALERREAEHYQAMQEALREMTRVNDDAHKDIKHDTDRILQLLLRERIRP